MEQPKRMVTDSFGTYYGYGPSANQIFKVTSCHERGSEPAWPGIKHLFDGLWAPERNAYMYGDVLYVEWKPVYLS
jgi:hypothetical protein